MLDASSPYSFFGRDYSGKIIGMETNLGWHNEEKGVFMIKQNFKKSEQLKKQLKEFELSILENQLNNESEEMKLIGMNLLVEADDAPAIELPEEDKNDKNR